MIKKLLYNLIFLIIICNIIAYNSFAEWTCESGCKIKWGTPETVLKYIENNNKIIDNISNNLWKSYTGSSIPTNISITWTKVSTKNSFSSKIWLRIYNSIFNWSEVESGFQYFLANIDWDVPRPISRDLRLIDNQNKKLNYFLSKVIKWWYSWDKFDIKKACNWVKDNWKCLEKLWNNTEDALRNLIKNNNTINLIIRKELWFMWFKSIVWSSSYDKLFWIPEDFKTEIKNNYNKETYKSCASCNGWSIDRFEKMKDKILLNDKYSKNWINEWIKTWDLLLWINDYSWEKYDKIERNLLNEELSRQWVSSKNWDAVLNDLKDFKWNKFWFSIWNNPIKNSFDNFLEQIKEPFESKQVNSLKKAIADINISTPEIEKFTYKDIVNTDSNIYDDSDIAQKIKILVKQNMWIIAKQNKATDKLQARIINLHYNLWKSIDTLEEIIIKSEKICDQQDNWAWKCNYRN